MQRPWGGTVLGGGATAKRLEGLGPVRPEGMAGGEAGRLGRAGSYSLRPGSGGCERLCWGLWEVTGGIQAAEHCDLICIFKKLYLEAVWLEKAEPTHELRSGSLLTWKDTKVSR